MKKMKITVKESTLVKPMEETPSGSMWLSSLDLLMPATFFHVPTVYFFRSDGAANFFDAAVLKAALSRALVDFYPFAGRLRKDDKGRIEINCNGEGVLFVVAECDGEIDDLGGFTPRADISLVHKVDYSQGISTFPLSLLQITRFKCGGVSLGVANEHHVADGIASLHYINTWSDIARGATSAATTPPSMDRRLLSARNPPQPQFPHIEYQPPPSLETPLDISETSLKTFGLTRDQLNTLKQKCKHGGDDRSYTTYEVIAGHVWRCVCMARRLPQDQKAKLQLPVDARPRLRPPLPPCYFGNGVFYAMALASCGEMESNPVKFAVGKVKDAVARMDDEYMRSALDYLELQLPKSEGIVRSINDVKCPNLRITSWVRLPFYEADFGWGKPIFAGLGEALSEGKCCLCADPNNEGGVLIAIMLLKPHMELFEKLLYDF
ncbi:hydroxycinnamoyl-CoA shikimate/quinate hydroxycinnamoyl transferase [Perilla frutescens var. hirtella]|uniref:Rosmarinate synthase n=1 Tax=Perilla frutescens var. hirtella TaxID=608512 RepID=A0AAD4JBP6_PERFH|nr:hydroxycinnamoyl-CoA shikimate/quinate hydroxycinnamoyl transferase [Perilla frutescens var. hirtella]